jgi:LPS-assembly protein
LPHDRLTGHSRYALNLQHDTALRGGVDVGLRVLRVSDDAYWKDFPRAVPSITPRLLATDLRLARPYGDWTVYGRIQQWQVLQDDSSRIEAPYERLPQVGARWLRRDFNGFELGFEGELNRFVDPDNARADPNAAERPTGLRLHALASISRPYTTPGWTLTPKLSFNAASYQLDEPLPDGRKTASRVIPTISVDSAWLFERDARWFGRAVRQTLEPRVLYSRTPYRAQLGLPNFDSAGKDLNFDSLFTENAFSGVDRVSDAHQVTAGVISRVLDPITGAEAMRLGIAQRYLFRPQRVTANADGTVDGEEFTQRFSDVLLLGSTTLARRWTLDASLQYSPDIKRTVRSVVGVRYSPGPYRTVNANYRLARGLSEQIDIGWQWPIYGPTPDRAPQTQAGPLGVASAGPAGSSCRGSWYSVGRINYSMRDSRITDSAVGFEYDAGCWIGRVVAERQSTGRSEATTRLMLQLELVGLSRLGSNPLQVLKDNIPGYRLLREERGTPATTNVYE